MGITDGVVVNPHAETIEWASKEDVFDNGMIKSTSVRHAYKEWIKE
jgi:hypothetical protein